MYIAVVKTRMLDFSNSCLSFKEGAGIDLANVHSNANQLKFKKHQGLSNHSIELRH